MQTTDRHQGHTYLMVATMVVLVAFLSYWLKSEFEKEKENIGLEQKMDYIDSLFMDLEIDSIVQNQSLKSIVLNKSTMHDSLPSKFNVKEVVSVQLTEEAKPLVVLNDSNEQSSVRTTMDVNTLEDKLLNNEYREITSSMVMKRIIPQMIIALLLLGSVFTTFWVLRSTLRKQIRLAEIKDDFVSNMTHELKTPISTIGVALEALKNFGADQNPTLRKEYMDITISEVKRLGLLVDKALNISLFEKGENTFEQIPVDLGDIVDTIHRTLRVYHEQNHIDIQIQKNGQQFTILGDSTHLTNIIHNLFENAIKYTNNDVRISLILEEQKENIVLQIRDNGIGINKEDLSKIFDKFYRVPQGNVHNTKGHGLGLSYVKMAVEKMSGDISVKSTPNQGSTFTMSFPKYTI